MAPDGSSSGQPRALLRLPPAIAPVRVAVLALRPNDAAQAELAQGVHAELSARLSEQGASVELDTTGSIGKRYRRQDEVGTPFCVTVDYDSVGKGKHEQDGTTSTGSHVPTVTLRERDTMTQTRMTITELFDVVSLQH